MQKSKLIWANSLIITIIALGIAYVVSKVPDRIGSAQQQEINKELTLKKESDLKKELNNLPIVDYQLTQIDSSAQQRTNRQSIRYLRNALHDGFPVKINEEGGDEIILHTHSMEEFPPIPTLKSDLVVIGNVANAQAFLSNDKSFVYSEYNIRVKEILKNASESMLSSTEFITAERIGGAVRFPSGRIRKYKESEYGTPLSGHEYVFFLKFVDVGKTFSILTAYELIDGRAIALDHAGRFLDYKDVPDGVVLNAIKESVKR